MSTFLECLSYCYRQDSESIAVVNKLAQRYGWQIRKGAKLRSLTLTPNVGRFEWHNVTALPSLDLSPDTWIVVDMFGNPVFPEHERKQTKETPLGAWNLGPWRE